jgi:hypothetical protein
MPRRRATPSQVQYETALNDGVINCTGNTNTVAPTLVYVNKFSADALGNLKCQVNQIGADYFDQPDGRDRYAQERRRDQHAGFVRRKNQQCGRQ